MHVCGISYLLKMETTFIHTMKSLFLIQSDGLLLIFLSAVNEQNQIPWAPSGAKSTQLLKIPCGCRGLSSSLSMASHMDTTLF